MKVERKLYKLVGKIRPPKLGKSTPSLTAWEIIRKYRKIENYKDVGDLYQRDIFVIHGKKLYQLSFRVISKDVEKRDNVTAELEPDFNEIFTSFRFID